MGIALACITLAVEYCYFKIRKPKPGEENIGSNVTIVTPIGNRTKLDEVLSMIINFQALVVIFNILSKEDAYGKGKAKPYVLDADKKPDQYTPEYGYFGAKKEAERE